MNIYAYKAGSQSAKLLAKGLGVKCIKHANSKFRGNNNKRVINWGSSVLPEEVMRCFVFNHLKAVSCASNKLLAFEAMARAGVRVPDFTTDREAAEESLAVWVTVVVRHKLNGHSGEGIELVSDVAQLPDAPLYVKYIGKSDEYRVHVVDSKVIHIQRKARRKDVPDDQVNWQVRNHANGFIFAHGAEALGHVPPDVILESIKAVEALGLDFGAVDVIVGKKDGKAYVLEVNTAPGLTGTTLDKYVEAFGGLV
jgi:glutathione synthase/RimK-type ligase-like ATP-grasp enzyme